MALTFHEFDGKEYILKEDHEAVIKEKISEVVSRRKEIERVVDEQTAQLKELQLQLEAKADIEGKLSKYQSKLALAKIGIDGEAEDDLEEVLKIALNKANNGKKEQMTLDQYVDHLKKNEEDIPFILKPFWKSKSQQAEITQQQPQQQPASKPAETLAGKTVRVPDSQPLSNRDQLLAKAKAGQIKFSEAYMLSRGETLPEKKEEK